MSNACTSYSLAAPSSPVVASQRPSNDAATSAIGPTCAWKCLTNSTPRCIFFQNLTCPSSEAVHTKPALAATCVDITVISRGYF